MVYWQRIKLSSGSLSEYMIVVKSIFNTSSVMVCF